MSHSPSLLLVLAALPFSSGLISGPELKSDIRLESLDSSQIADYIGEGATKVAHQYVMRTAAEYETAITSLQARQRDLIVKMKNYIKDRDRKTELGAQLREAADAHGAWVHTGPLQVQKLKRSFMQSKDVHQAVRDSCEYGDPGCELHKVDTLLCESIYAAGKNEKLGDPENIARAINEAASNGNEETFATPTRWMAMPHFSASTPPTAFEEMLNQTKSEMKDDTKIATRIKSLCASEDFGVQYNNWNTCHEKVLMNMLCRKLEVAATKEMGSQLVPILEGSLPSTDTL